MMKRRKGIAFLSIAAILLVFSTLTAIFIHNLSKDLFKSQSQALKAKTVQYAKIAIVSMKNWVDATKPTSGSSMTDSFDSIAIPVVNTFFLDLTTPDSFSEGFYAGLESVRVDNSIMVGIYEGNETTGAVTTSLYAMIDSTQTNLLGPQQDTTVYVYSEQGYLFEGPTVSFPVFISPDYRESVIYKFR
mgnify:CR=1 FL=1